MKIVTGFSFVDLKWGGVYPGGNYLIFGSKKSGKTVLALKIIEYLTQNNHNTLLLTSDRKKSLEIQTASVYFEMEEPISNGLLSVIKIDDSFADYDKIKLSINC